MPEETAQATLDMDALADRMASRFRMAQDAPAAGSERIVRFDQDGNWEIVGEQKPWWESFAQHEPDPGTLIEITREGPRPFDSLNAIDRLSTYEFGARRMWLDFIERPLNNAFRQFPYLGSIVVGGVPALLAAEAINGFTDGSTLSENTKTWVKAGSKAAVGVAVPLFVGDQLMSRIGQVVFGGTLILSAAQDISQIDKLIKNAVIWVRNLFRSAGEKLPYENRFAQGRVVRNRQTRTLRALNPGQRHAQSANNGPRSTMGYNITGLGELGTNKLDYVVSPY